MRLDPVIASVGASAPRPIVARLLRHALQGLEVALCLHRVVDARPEGQRQPELSIPAAELDDLLDLLLSAQSTRGGRWLTVTFDDGYADAADYVERTARRFP